MPWWVSVLLAAASYYTLKYLVPQLQVKNPILEQVIAAAPSFAPIVTIPLLLLAAAQLYDTDEPKDKENHRED
jgi:hypothetical protein